MAGTGFYNIGEKILLDDTTYYVSDVFHRTTESYYDLWPGSRFKHRKNPKSISYRKPQLLTREPILSDLSKAYYIVECGNSEAKYWIKHSSLNTKSKNKQKIKYEYEKLKSVEDVEYHISNNAIRAIKVYAKTDDMLLVEYCEGFEKLTCYINDVFDTDCILPPDNQILDEKQTTFAFDVFERKRRIINKKQATIIENLVSGWLKKANVKDYDLSMNNVLVKFSLGNIEIRLVDFEQANQSSEIWDLNFFHLLRLANVNAR